MRSWGIFLIVAAVVMLTPLVIAVVLVFADWVRDALHRELCDEYSFYWIAIIAAVLCLFAGIIMVCES